MASCEQRLNGTTRILITEADISYIYEEIHRMRAVQPLLMICARPSLLRWNKNKGLEWDNLALFEREAGDL